MLHVTACSVGDTLLPALLLLKTTPSSYRVILCSNGWDFCLHLQRRQQDDGPKSTQLQTASPSPALARAGKGAGVASSVPYTRRTACPFPGPERPLRSLIVPSLPLQLSSVPTAGGNDGSLFNSLLQKRIWIKSKRPLPLRVSKITDLEESVKCPTLRSWKECAITALSQETGPLDCGYHLPPSIFCTWNIYFWQHLEETPLGICYMFSSNKIQSVY